MKFSDIFAEFEPFDLEEACVSLRRIAAHDRNWLLRRSELASEISHSIVPEIWDLQIAAEEKLRLFFEFYEGLPSYAVLMYINQWFDLMEPEQHRVIWERFRVYLSESDARLAEPVMYVLLVDFFVDGSTVDEAWAELVKPESSPLQLDRVARASHAVPWAMKAPLYRRLLKDVQRHDALLEGLYGSAFNVCGDIDPDEARELTEQLQLPEDYPLLGELREKLTPDAAPS